MKNFVMLAALLVPSAPLAAEPAAPAVAESKLDHSSASVMVEPKLDDGRLVLKIAVQNRTSAGIAFGPASISIAKPSGEAIGLVPLQRLIDDVRIAAGDVPEKSPSDAMTAGAYASSDDALRSSEAGTTINQDSVVQPGQVAAGQLVSEKLKFKKGEDRTLYLRISIAGDEHGFTIAAPKD